MISESDTGTGRLFNHAQSLQLVKAWSLSWIVTKVILFDLAFCDHSCPFRVLSCPFQSILNKLRLVLSPFRSDLVHSSSLWVQSGPFRVHLCSFLVHLGPICSFPVLHKSVPVNFESGSFWVCFCVFMYRVWTCFVHTFVCTAGSVHLFVALCWRKEALASYLYEEKKIASVEWKCEESS